MRLRIKTRVVVGFAAMLVLLTGVAAVAITGTEQIRRLAGDLNGRVVDKTRIAADIVDLGQQIRFVDGFLLKSDDPEQDDLAQRLIGDRGVAVDRQIASYTRFVDTDLERSLLQNLDRSRKAYLALQRTILATPVADRRRDAAEDEEKLAAAFDQANRQARGLSRVAEAEARAAREQVVGIARDARMAVLVAAGLALLIGLAILAMLLASVFHPLVRITRALVDLSQGRLDVALDASARGGEMDDMLNALEVFRTNAVALAEAHEQTKAAHQRADLLARHDVLTGLPNRRVLTFAIGEAIARSGRRGLDCAVLVLDLDRFKPVNDLYGHGAGDKVLCEVAHRLSATLRSGETAARLGGDEFAVVIEYEPGSDAPRRVAKRIIGSVNMPIAIDGRTVSVGTSIGVALYPADGQDAEALLHAADLAMFKAKREERNSFRCFEPEMDAQLRARANLEARITRAVREGLIRPHYQPLVDLKSQRIVGFELLARWHDGDTVRLPCDFIQIADEAGLMPEMTYSVLRQACRDTRDWPDHLTLALNITPAQIADARLPEALFSLLAEERFPPHRLELEITENALIGDVTSARSVMAALREKGVRISLDDFGTGYSSLHHLRDLKFDKLKIDRSFVQSMIENAESTKIVETILSLGRSLGINTIAEGIEDGEHLRSLLDHGCEFGQGYYLGKPIAAAGVEAVLRQDAARAGALTRAA